MDRKTQGGDKIKAHSKLHQASTAKRKRARWLYCLQVRRALREAGDDDDLCRMIIVYACWRMVMIGLYLTDKALLERAFKAIDDGRWDPARDPYKYELKATYGGILSYLHRIDRKDDNFPNPRGTHWSWHDWMQHTRWKYPTGGIGKHRLQVVSEAG
jgi:hypothetical protein